MVKVLPSHYRIRIAHKSLHSFTHIITHIYRAWDGGKIITNKAEALRKFLARKKMTNLTEEQKKVVELAMRKNKEDTVFVKDFVKMKKDSSPKNVNSLLKASSKKTKQGKNNKNKKRIRGQSRQERNSLKKKRKHNKKDDKVQKKKKKKRSDSMSLLNGALTSRR